jgi:16S rRNA (adenine1518-N6/adenine1519-N6)-dimethyltransferase
MSNSIPGLLRAHGLHARKHLGQNFLSDPAILDRIVAAADLSREDTVLEVGAGLGSLTKPLARRAGQVVAVELDDQLVAILRERTADLPNVRILHADILRVSGFGFHHRGYKVVGNLPYYITSAILRRFLEKEPRPALMVITVQREVADRIVAGPGDLSLLAVSVQFYTRPQIVTRIKAGAFYPPPKVDSAVLRLDIMQQPAVTLPAGQGEAGFFRVVRAGFAQKRKTLRNALSAGLGIPASQTETALNRAGIDPRRRAETLSLQEWADLTRSLES